MTPKMYFATDGNYGDAENLVVLDVTGLEQAYGEVFDELAESERYAVANDIWKGLGSIDQQDCPAVEYREDGNLETVHEIECGFTGYVYRAFLDPARGEDGGYTWTCPQCGNEAEWEGVEPDEDAPTEVTGTISEPLFPATLAVPRDLISAVLITREQDQITAQFAEVTEAVPATRAELAQLFRALAEALEQQESDLQPGA